MKSKKNVVYQVTFKILIKFLDFCLTQHSQDTPQKKPK